MEQIQEFLSSAKATVGVIISLVGLFATTVTFIAKYIQKSKNKKVAEIARKTAEAAQKTAENIITIGNAILPFIKEAEAFTHYSGTEKKAYVTTNAINFAISKEIPFDGDLVSEKIEELVKLTKEVNMREKDTINILK